MDGSTGAGLTILLGGGITFAQFENQGITSASLNASTPVFFVDPSNELVGGTQGTQARGITGGLAVVTPVPIETDALPILGAVAFMGAGFWFKRRQAQAKANLNFLAPPQGTEPVLEKSV